MQQIKKHLSPKQAGISRLPLLLVLLVLLGIVFLVSVNRQNLLDYWRLRQYQAPDAIAKIARQDTMTNYGRKVFYVNQPALSDKAAFRTKCPNNGGERSIVLGCYHGGQNGIYLLNVSDSRLNGVEPVTAAHEMLHAAYDRLSGSDRAKVNAMLADYYAHGLQDERIKKIIDGYKKTEPHDVVNEMHSVFGTEVASLPADLEQYYQRYFSQRGQVAALAARYQSEFASRQAAVANYDAQLISLKAQIDTTEANLKTQQSSIESQRNTLVALRNSGNTGAYNAGIPAYNNMIDRYNAQAQATQGLIDRYNQLVTSRNAIALEEDELANDLNANANAAPLK